MSTLQIKDKVLILKDEVNDEMMEEFLSLVNSDDVESIVIKTDNISSLVLQQLFCIKKNKNISCEDPFLSKFFDDIQYIA